MGLPANTLRLRQIMHDHDLKGHDVVDLLGCALKTVHCWRSATAAPIPDRELERLELKLQVKALTQRIQYLENKIGVEPRARAAV